MNHSYPLRTWIRIQNKQNYHEHTDNGRRILSNTIIYYTQYVKQTSSTILYVVHIQFFSFFLFFNILLLPPVSCTWAWTRSTKTPTEIQYHVEKKLNTCKHVMKTSHILNILVQINLWTIKKKTLKINVWFKKSVIGQRPCRKFW